MHVCMYLCIVKSPYLFSAHFKSVLMIKKKKLWSADPWFSYLFVLSFKLVNLKRISAVKFISDFIFSDLFTRPESKSLHLIFCRQWSLCRDVKSQFTAADFNMFELWQIITMHKKITVHNGAWFCICEGKEKWSRVTVDLLFMLKMNYWKKEFCSSSIYLPETF